MNAGKRHTHERALESLDLWASEYHEAKGVQMPRATPPRQVTAQDLLISSLQVLMLSFYDV